MQTSRYARTLTAAAGALGLVAVCLCGCKGKADPGKTAVGGGPTTAGGQLQSRDPSVAAFTLYFTADVRGEVAPVGCSNGYYGGMARAAAFLAASSVPGESLLIDGGDFLGPVVDTAGLKARMSSYAAMGYGAMALGDNELRYGVAEVVAAAKAHGVRLVSSNVLDATSNKPVVEPTWVWTSVGGVKVGLFSVLEPRVVGAGDGKAAGVVVGDPYAAAATALESLKTQGVEVIVAVAHGPNDLAKNLAVTYPEIDFVISAHPGRTLEFPLPFGRAHVGSSASGGSHVGEVAFWLPSEGPGDSDTAPSTEPRFALVQTEEMRLAAEKARARELESVERELSYVQSRQAELGNRGGVAQRLGELQSRQATLKAEAAAEESTEGSGLRLRYRLHRLVLELPEDPKVAATVAPYNRGMR